MPDAAVTSGVTSTGLNISSGTVTVSSGGTAIDTVLSGKENTYTGFLTVEKGGVAINTRVERNGRLTVYSGGTAVRVTESGGFVGVLDGATVTFAPNWFSETIPYMGTATIHSGTTGYRTTIAKGASLFIYSGGFLESSTLSISGYVHVSSGGYASFTYVFDSSCLKVSSGGTAKTVIINENGSAIVYSGGTMQNVMLDTGRLTVSSGGLVTSITISSGAELYVENGGKVEYLTSTTGANIHSSAGAIVSYGNGGGTSSGGSQVPTIGDNGWNNYLYDKKQTPELNTSVFNMNPIKVTSDTRDIRLDSKGEIAYEGLNNFVGYGDKADFAKITLTCGAKLAFNISTTGGAKFTIWSLTVTGYDKNENPKYKMKAVQTITIKKNEYFAAGTANFQKAPLLEPGEYFISMEASSTKKGSEVYYSVTLNTVSEFYTKGKNFDDAWSAFADSGYSGEGYLGTLTESKKNVLSDWVGTGDLTDYRKFTIAKGAMLSFSITADDATSFSIIQVESKTGKKGGTTEKKLVSVSLKKRGYGDYSIVTKPVLLEAGDYYLCVTSTNGKKGGSADYSVVQNTNECVYFDQGNNTDDWDDLAEKGAAGKAGSIGKVDGKKEKLLEDWVGFGDAVDYKKFTIATAAKLDFAIISSDVVKFSVCQLESKPDKKKGTTVYSLKTLLSATVKKNGKHDNYLALTKSLLLDAGDYYFCVESTNAKKGGSADYTVNLDTGESVFFTKGKNNDDWDDLAEKGAAGKFVKIGELKSNTAMSDWVGYGDAVDYRQFTIKNGASVSFEISAEDAAKFTVYQLVGKTDKKGNTTYSLKSLQSTGIKTNVLTTTKKLKLEAGEYYFSMESTNANKGGNAAYDIRISEISALPQKGKDADALAMTGDVNEWRSLADSIVSSGLVLTGETAPGSGFVTLSGGDLASLAMPGVDDVSVSPIPVSASDDLFDGLSDSGKTPDLLA